MEYRDKQPARPANPQPVPPVLATAWRLLAAACVLFGVLSGRPLRAADWPRFRGPNGSGRPEAADAAALARVPATWTPHDYRWQANLPGVGNSSPVVSGERVVVTSADPNTATFYVLCFQIRTGRELWRHAYPSAPYHLHTHNTYATSTPAVDDQRAYVMFTSPQKYAVAALNLADGKEAWQVDLGPFSSQHGFGASPIVYHNMVIVPNDQDGDSFLVALSPTTGGQIWKTKRHGGLTSYSSPCVFEVPGRDAELIFTSSLDGMTGVNPRTGQQNWSLDLFPARTVGSPIVADGLVLANCGTGGSGKTLVAVHPGATPSAPAKLVYEITEKVPYITTPIVANGLLFYLQDRGFACCYELATGKRVWQQRVGGNFAGSPVLLGDRLYCMAEDGDVVVIAAGRQYKLLGRTPLGEPSRATPAAADGMLLLRTQSKLFCLAAAPAG